MINSNAQKKSTDMTSTSEHVMVLHINKTFPFSGNNSKTQQTSEICLKVQQIMKILAGFYHLKMIIPLDLDLSE